MKKYIRNQDGQFLTSTGNWTIDVDQARCFWDLRTVLEEAESHGTEKIHLILQFDNDPGHDLVIPLRESA